MLLWRSAQLNVASGWQRRWMAPLPLSLPLLLLPLSRSLLSRHILIFFSHWIFVWIKCLEDNNCALLGAVSRVAITRRLDLVDITVLWPPGGCGWWLLVLVWS